MKDLADYYKHKQMADGHLNKCKECVKGRVSDHRDNNLERIQEYDRNRPNHTQRAEYNRLAAHKKKAEDPKKYAATRKEILDRYNTKYPEKAKAHNAVSIALRDGKLLRPSVCEKCNISDVRIEGHHESYEEKDWLDVIWLCDPCHKARHKEINAEVRSKSQLDKLTRANN